LALRRGRRRLRPCPLLERESALASLVEYAAEARAGERRLVLVGGEAGVGKSTLVEALAERLAGARWAWGMCDGLFTPRPLGPLSTSRRITASSPASCCGSPAATPTW
jgi:predicted ATPase